MAEPRRWFNPNLPQLLQIAVFLFYFDAVLDLLGILSSPTSIRFMAGFYRALLFVSVAGSVGAANGIANENKWGYKLGVGIAALPFVINLVGFGLLTVGGWLGGSIVFVHGMRVLNLVDEPALKASAPVVTPEKEQAEGA